MRSLLQDFHGVEPLKRLFWSELSYERVDEPLSRRDWGGEAYEALAEDPVLLAAAGEDEGFEVIYCRLAGKLLIRDENSVIPRLVSEGHDRALFVFSDDSQTHWHFVNVRHGEGGRLYRRIAVGPGEELRTASERVALLEAETAGPSALDFQDSLDKAFDVEKVTNEFFREYARVFERVENSIEGIEDGERRRLFTQRLFNRLMFIAFVQKKGWLRFGGRTGYLNALFEDYARDDFEQKNFYRDRLKFLFFEGLSREGRYEAHGANRGGYTAELIGETPYLNGGLFERDEYDDDEDITVPDEALRAVLADLFGRFNFTVTESTPLDVEVAVDPEMLGRVFEELVTGRHESGSYYTPKPVVSFMCREALKGHLQSALNDSPEEIRRFVEDGEPAGLGDPERALEALRSMRVCDPACGSGAYLLGMLGELLELRQSLFNARRLDDRYVYDRKLEIIQRSLYGVDSDEFAVNIAKLRLWLSLVVEDSRNPLDEPDANVALPNLDFKIETGDSLTAPDPSGHSQTDLARGSEIDEFSRLKDEYLRSHDKEKEELRARIHEMRSGLIEWLHAGKQPEGFDWQVEFAEVFHEGGFDAVLANPPYVRQELIKAHKPRLKEVYPEVYAGTADLYVYFYARALQLLKPGGMLAFISSNKWFRANYGKKLRKHLAETSHVRNITDFGDLPVFQGASAYPMIFTAEKGGDTDSPTLFTEAESLQPPYPDVAALIRQSGEPLPPEAINGEDWLLTDAKTAARLTKMRATGIPLGEYVEGRIYRGVLTGFNEAFVIDGARREELISRDPKSAEIIKPFAVGRDIRKWTVDYRDRWLIVTQIGVDMDRYPAIFEHLKQWQPQLEKRGDQGKYWWELRPCDYYEAFERPKIVFPDIAKDLRFAFDTQNIYTNNTTYFIPADDLYLLGLLNSSSVEEFYVELSAQIRGGYLRFFTQYLKQIPIPDAPAAEREAIADLVQRCLDAGGVGCEESEREIDGRVARLYGL